MSTGRAAQRAGRRTPGPGAAGRPNVWAARSPCDPRCVAADAARVPAARALRRTAAFGAVVAGAFADSGRLGDPEVLRARAQDVLDALGVTLDRRGGALSAPGPTGTLIVANHISWLDIVALLAVEPVTMLAKRQVGQWPLVGTLVRRAGTLFIDRDSLRELPATVARIAGLLRAGRSVMVFPQGVTWCQGTGGPFRRATFQAALDAGAPVRPVSLDYFQRRRPTTVAAFVGDDDFAGSLRRVVRAADLSVRVTVHGAVLPVPGTDDRRGLAARARAAVAGAPGFATPVPRAHGPLDHGPGARETGAFGPAFPAVVPPAGR
ncbi:lysophospholipid acyltransferase family protein [Streptomyces pactum]|uniref:lysophospholipid acyltransferase family protein n=1 Tax=Streptomyces pactum TaxID=68249 RepID=UPI0036F73E56